MNHEQTRCASAGSNSGGYGWWREHQRAWEEDLMDEMQSARGEESAGEPEEFDRAVNAIVHDREAWARRVAREMYPGESCVRCGCGPRDDPPRLLWDWGRRWLCARCNDWIFGGSKSS